MKQIVDELLSCDFTSQPLDVEHYVEIVKTVVATQTRTIVALSTISYRRVTSIKYRSHRAGITAIIRLHCESAAMANSMLSMMKRGIQNPHRVPPFIYNLVLNKRDQWKFKKKGK